jgi:Metallo-beta-lactamase superfamily
MSNRIQIGEIVIQRIVEQEGPFFDALQFFPALTPELLAENRGWMRPKFLDAEDKLVLCIQSYLVQTPGRNILIDTCVGNHKPRPTRAFWHMLKSDRYERNLAACGLGAGDIDFVLCTHLHPDHSPLQARYPELSARPDYDAKQSAQTRRKLFGEIGDSSTLLCTAHFPSPSVGRLVRRHDAFDFVAL